MRRVLPVLTPFVGDEIEGVSTVVVAENIQAARSSFDCTEVSNWWAWYKSKKRWSIAEWPE